MTKIKADVGAVLIKLKPDSEQSIEAWQLALNQRKAEAVETLKAEGVQIESWFQLQIEGQDYLIAYMRADDIKQAQQIAKSSTFAIDHLHKQFKTNWAQVHPAKLLVDLLNDDDS